MARDLRMKGASSQAVQDQLVAAAEAVGCNGNTGAALLSLGKNGVDARDILAVLDAVKHIQAGGRETHRSLAKRASNSSRVPMKRTKTILRAFGLTDADQDAREAELVG